MERTKLLASAEMNCMSFVNNLALSDATREQLGRGRVLSNFWSRISRNALDLAVLDWCHAFGQQNDALHWRKVFPDDEEAFREGMLTSMEVSLDEFKQFREQMKVYRDKDLAHLELRNISMIPAMNKAIHSMAFYYHQIQCAKRELDMHCRDRLCMNVSTAPALGLIVMLNWPSALRKHRVARTFRSVANVARAHVLANHCRPLIPKP